MLVEGESISGLRRIGGAQGVSETDAFPVRMYIPALRHTIYGRFAGVNLTGGGRRRYALLGRTFSAKLHDGL